MASISMTVTHPALPGGEDTETVSATDARVMEFANLLASDYYPEEGEPPVPLTPRAALLKYMREDVLDKMVDLYKGLKQVERDRAAVGVPDITDPD